MKTARYGTLKPRPPVARKSYSPLEDLRLMPLSSRNVETTPDFSGNPPKQTACVMHADTCRGAPLDVETFRGAAALGLEAGQERQVHGASPRQVRETRAAIDKSSRDRGDWSNDHRSDFSDTCRTNAAFCSSRISPSPGQTLAVHRACPGGAGKTRTDRCGRTERPGICGAASHRAGSRGPPHVTGPVT
jgi:hypothetical protein